MTDSNQVNEIPPEYRDALLARADEFRVIESRYDELLRQAERELGKAEQAMNKQLGNGASERECLDTYIAASNEIKVKLAQDVKALEDDYKRTHQQQTAA